MVRQKVCPCCNGQSMCKFRIEATSNIRVWRADSPPPDVIDIRNVFGGVAGVSHINMRHAKHKRMRIQGVRIK